MKNRSYQFSLIEEKSLDEFHNGWSCIKGNKRFAAKNSQENLRKCAQ